MTPELKETIETLIGYYENGPVRWEELDEYMHKLTVTFEAWETGK